MLLMKKPRLKRLINFPKITEQVNSVTSKNNLTPKSTLSVTITNRFSQS